MTALAERVALVVGAGAGLGQAIAIAFSREGAQVCAAGRTLEKVQRTTDQLQRNGRDNLAVEADITKLSDIERMVDSTLDHFGRIDVLVNSAGIQSEPPLLDITEPQWDAIMGVQLKGVFFTIQRVLPGMLERSKGKIINLSSVFGVRGKKDSFVYCAAKGGIINLTRALAIEVGTAGVCVNAIAPGFTLNPLHDHITSDPGLIAALVGRIPMGRPGLAEEITGAAIYLASDASSFTTGTTIFVDGGESAL